MEIDIDNKYWYGASLGYDNDLTRERLIEIKEIGYTECGEGQFGVKGITSGLYIEKLWGYNDGDWKYYINWAKKLIKEKR